jgi:hypothetical protein
MKALLSEAQMRKRDGDSDGVGEGLDDYFYPKGVQELDSEWMSRGVDW